MSVEAAESGSVSSTSGAHSCSGPVNLLFWRWKAAVIGWSFTKMTDIWCCVWCSDVKTAVSSELRSAETNVKMILKLFFGGKIFLQHVATAENKHAVRNRTQSEADQTVGLEDSSRRVYWWRRQWIFLSLLSSEHVDLYVTAQKERTGCIRSLLTAAPCAPLVYGKTKNG